MNEIPYTLKETSELLRVTKETIHRWMKEGKIQNYKKVGRKWLFDRNEINSMLPTSFNYDNKKMKRFNTK